jgi:hypothetical protein
VLHLTFRHGFRSKSSEYQNPPEIILPLTNHIKQTFPKDWPKIQEARRTNARLNEICTDFEILSSDVEKAGKEPNVMSDNLKADFTMSIEALEDEVANWLRFAKRDRQLRKPRNNRH